MGKKSIVVFEVNEVDQCDMVAIFEGLHHEVTTLNQRDLLLEKIKGHHVDLVVIGADHSLVFSIDLLKEIKAFAPHLPVILTASEADSRGAVAAMKSGAADFFIKPLDAGMLENFVWPMGAASREPLSAQTDLDKFTIITRDDGMAHLMRAARKVADSRASVLIQGASGTGKELMARYVHNCSHRRNKPFVAINCAALPVTLLESELFGHEKGSFTGALGRKRGKFELADGGTLLLDEISEMDYPLQAKLLRVLQERVIDRIGGVAPVPIDVRILATTNADLEGMACDGSFREDLYYRLNVIAFRLPTLEERRDDIPLLAEHFLRKYNEIDGKDVKGLTPEAMELLFNRSWRGNVRELENAIERAVLMAEGAYLEVEDFSVAGHQRYGGYPSPSLLPVGSLKEMEEKIIFQTLDHTNDNRTHAAKILGISVRTLRNKLNEYKEKMVTQ